MVRHSTRRGIYIEDSKMIHFHRTCDLMGSTNINNVCPKSCDKSLNEMVKNSEEAGSKWIREV